MNKKALSAFLAMSSMAGVMAPSMTAFAAEENKNTVEDLITYAKNAKDLYHYNQAYAAIMADKDNANFNTWLGELAPVAKEIKGYDEMMKIIAEIQDEVQKNQSIEQYNAVVAKVQSLFDNGSICKTDKEYLDAELVYWTRTPIFTTQSDLTKVIDKTNEAAKLLADGKAREAQTAIDAAKAILAGENNINQANETYLQQNTVAPVAQNVEAAVAKLPIEVVSATAINPIEMQVKFDAPVDRNTAIDLANYEIAINNGKTTLASVNPGDAKQGIIDVELGADKQTVTFRLNQPMQNGTRYVMNINDGIYSVNKDKKVAVTPGNEQTFNDKVAPSLVSVGLDSENNNNLELTFSEPVNTQVGAIIVDGNTLTANTLTAKNPNEAGNYKYSVSLANKTTEISNLTAIGNHNVTIYDVNDTCPGLANEANTLTAQYDITKTSQNPMVTSIAPDDDNDREFIVKFDKNVLFNTINKEGNIKVKNNGLKYKLVNTFTPDAGKLQTPLEFKVIAWDADKNTAVDVSKLSADQLAKLNVKAIKVTIGHDTDAYKLYKDGADTADLSVELTGYKTEAGFLGDKFKGDVTLSKDAAGPQVKLGSDETIVNDTGINVKFNKEIKNAQQAKIVVKDSEGIARAIKEVKITNDKEGKASIVNITLEGNPDYDNNAPYSVIFEDGAVEDANSQNIVYNSQQEVTVRTHAGIQAKIIPTVEVPNLDAVGGVATNVINVNYKCEMTKSATDLNNYTINGKALPADSKVVMSSDNKSVKITLSQNSISVGGAYNFGISKNVVSKDGSIVVGNITTDKNFTQVINLKDNTKPVMESASFVIANSTSQESNIIKVKFSENIDPASIAKENAIKDFKVIVNGNTINVSKLEAASTKDTIDLVLQSNQKITSDASISIVPVGDDGNTAMDIADNSGNTIAATTTSLELSTPVQGDKTDLKIMNDLAINAAIKAVQGAKDADKLLAALQAPVLGLKNVNADNSAQYFVEYQKSPEMATIENIQTNIVDAGNATAAAAAEAAAKAAAIKAVQEAKDADTLLTALQAKELALKNVNEANKDQYFTAQKAKPEMATIENIQTNIVDAGNAQAEVQAVADKLNVVTPKADEKKLVIPTEVGYTIKMKSNNDGVIADNGTITPPSVETPVELTFTVTNDTTKKVATKVITVNVPAKTSH